eukprot:1065002-Lingulodinium_polyedra.AAC.1
MTRSHRPPAAAAARKSHDHGARVARSRTPLCASVPLASLWLASLRGGERSICGHRSVTFCKRCTTM